MLLIFFIKHKNNTLNNISRKQYLYTYQPTYIQYSMYTLHIGDTLFFYNVEIAKIAPSVDVVKAYFYIVMALYFFSICTLRDDF